MKGMEHVYKLEKYDGPASRYTCPACNKPRQFTRYVNPTDGSYLADDVGKCNRVGKCAYHRTPKQHFQDNPSAASSQPRRQAKAEPVKPVEYINPEVLKATLTAYGQNSFVKYLTSLFNPETVQELIDMYGVGTARNGAAVFWQVDQFGLVRTAKIILYGPDGHRDKQHPPYFIHKKLNIDNVAQCLYGQHLLKVSNGPFGLVESEKTSIILAGKFPGITWLATGGAENYKLAEVLKGRRVLACPDTDAHSLWTEKLSPYGFRISNALQQYISDPGYDLADVLPSESVPDHSAIEATPEHDEPYLEQLADGRTIEMSAKGYPASWDIKELIDRFDLVPVNENLKTNRWVEKPHCMPMMSVDDYRKNDWKS
jgi:hypothetical protein